MGWSNCVDWNLYHRHIQISHVNMRGADKVLQFEVVETIERVIEDRYDITDEYHDCCDERYEDDSEEAWLLMFITEEHGGFDEIPAIRVSFYEDEGRTRRFNQMLYIPNAWAERFRQRLEDAKSVKQLPLFVE